MTTPSAAEVPAWARENGLTVAARGRVCSDVLTAWQSAQTPARSKRLAAKPEAARTSGARSARNGASPDKKSSTSAVRAELAALNERLQRLEIQLATKPAKPKQ